MILDHPSQLDRFKGRSVFLYPILQDPYLHPSKADIIGLVLVDTNTKETFSISISHPEGVYQHPLSLKFLNDSVVYCYDTSIFKYKQLDVSLFVDSQAQYYLYSNHACNFETPSVINHYRRLYHGCRIVGSLVGLSKHQEIALDLFQTIHVKDVQPGLSFYQTTLLPALHSLERAGLRVDSNLYKQHFNTTPSLIGDYSFTQYNPYTTTGRPSNRFGGVNFAALNKEDGSRDCFISRFGDQGRLIEIDFNAYHPRLIASLVGYEFGPEGAYKHLASQFYGSSATDLQIDQMKEATFRQIYGGVQDHYLNIPFFYAADQLAKHLWQSFEQHDFVESPVSGRKLQRACYSEIDSNLLFNYFIQMYETECNMVVLHKLIDQLALMQSKPILYTYDSVLFDVHTAEQGYLLDRIIPGCVDTKQFPVKIKTGLSYGTLSV